MDYNMIISKEKSIIDDICDMYNYDNNIRHLLYVIVPAFIIKYGINRESIIINTFKNVRIYISNDKSDNVHAFYTSIPKFFDGKIITEKRIVINNYEKIGLVNLLDDIIHEFNHAVNSFNNEITVFDNKFFLRAGLTYSVYDINRLSSIKKDNSYVLEEVINTRQTESIINIIKGFDSKNDLIGNTIYSINNEILNNYNSMAYYYEGYICNSLLNNKTFMSTIEILRISGNISDIESWFDNITSKGMYIKFINYLYKIFNLELELSKTKYFKSFKINKVKNITRDVMNIIQEFNDNTKYS